MGRTGMTAGMIDSMIYAGSAFSGVLGGVIYEHAGAAMLFLSWTGAAVVSAAMIVLAARLFGRYFGK